MDGQQIHHPGNEVTPGQTKVLLSASVSALAYAGSLIIVLCGVVLRLWLDSYQTELSAIRAAAGAETTARIDLEVRVSIIEKSLIELREQNKRRDELIRDNKWRIDHHQGDGHGGRSRGRDRERD